MSRITAPVTKLTRTIGSNTSSISRPSNFLSNGSKSAISASRSSESWDHTDSQDHNSSRHLTTLTPSHRPVPRRGVIPLMQTFNITPSANSAMHTAPSIRTATSPIDFAVLPSQDYLFSHASVAEAVRVPLLPDNFRPDRSSPAMAAETPDAPLAQPEIHVVAATPENVVSAVSEVEGMGVDGVELGFVHGLEAAKSKVAEESGMIRDLWKGLMDDVFGEEKKVKAA